jgi:hypothetical protein
MAVSILLLGGLPLLGIDLASGWLVRWNRGDYVSWQSLGSPPIKATSIAYVDLDVVCVRGADGSLAACEPVVSTRKEGCWRPIDALPDRDERIDHRDTFRGQIPPAPGTVVDSLDLSFDWAERATHARYVLLDDGTVWQWRHNADANTALGIVALGTVCGLALAIAILAVLWLVVGLRALLERRRAPKD